MAADEIHQYDIGTRFEITLKDEGNSPEIVDVSTASVTEIIFKKPDGNTVTKTAGFTTDGTDGKIEYTTLANDLDTVGHCY